MVPVQMGLVHSGRSLCAWGRWPGSGEEEGNEQGPGASPHTGCVYSFTSDFSDTPTRELGVSPSVSIYTTEIGKHYKSGFYLFSPRAGC